MLSSALSFVLLAVLCGGAFAHANGPPLGACENLRPGAPHGFVAGTGNGGYVLVLPAALTDNVSTSNGGFGYEPNANYRVMIKNLDESITFKGYFVQVIRANKNNDIDMIGEIPGLAEMGIPGVPNVGQDEFQHRINCPHPDGSSSRSAVAHRNPDLLDFTSRSFNWVAPGDAGGGYVAFRYSVVKVMDEYWFDLRTYMPSNYVVLGTDGSIMTNEPPTFIPAKMSVMDAELELRKKSGDASNQLVLSEPDGCVVSSCTTYVSIVRKKEDEDHVNIYMEGESSSWVAVGFSISPNMYSTDVLACSLDSNDMVSAVDTWNLPETRNNEFDADQEDISLIAGEYANGRIRCQLRRKIKGTSKEQDFDLNGDFYNIFGVGGSGTPLSMKLVPHAFGSGNNPTVSSNMFNLGTLSLFGDGVFFISGHATRPGSLVLLLLVASLVALIVKV